MFCSPVSDVPYHSPNGGTIQIILMIDVIGDINLTGFSFHDRLNW